MDEKKSERSYGGKALIPMLVFLGLYLGCGIVFTILGGRITILDDASVRSFDGWYLSWPDLF